MPDMQISLLQCAALYKVYNRAPIFKSRADDEPITFEDFLESVQPTFGMDGAITVPWAGMWLAIERDGYTHS